MPYVLDEGKDNYRWDFIKNEFLVRQKDGDKFDWFIIHVPKKKRDARSIENTVTCSHICAGLKTKNIYLTFDGDETGIGTLPALATEILKGTGWRFDEEGSDTIYEEDGQTEKIRSMKSNSKAGAYKMITDLCTLFDAYPVFHTSEDGRDKMVTFHAMDNKGDMREVMIGKDLDSISFEENSEDIITRLYVEGEYGDDGYVGIDDVNPTGLTYLMNFSYYKENGLFTAEHQAKYDAFLESVQSITDYIHTHGTEITDMSNRLNDLWGQPLLVQYNINKASHQIESTIKSSDEITDDKLPIALDDILFIVGSGGRYRKEVVTNVSTFGFGTGDEYAVKYITTGGKSNAAGQIGAKEVSIEAKESAISQIERMKRQTVDEQKIAEYDQQIAEIQAQIKTIYEGVPQTDVKSGTVQTQGLYEMYYDAMKLHANQKNALAVLDTYQGNQADIEAQFYMDMGDMLKDGYWSNTNYITGQEQFLYADAVKVLNQMSRPSRKYTVNRVAMSDVLGYDLNDFDVNTEVRIYDPKINVNDIVYVKKITRYLDTPWKDKVELTNESITLSGKSLDSILQRITSVANEMENRKDVFSKAKAITSSGQVLMERLEGTIDVMKNRILSSVSSWYTDDNGNIMFEAADGQSAMKLSGDGWMIANGKTEDGEWNWRTAATGRGITADAIVTGYLSAAQIEAGSITGDKLDIHAGDSLDLSANKSIRIAIEDEFKDLEFSSGDNLQPGTSSTITQVEVADEYVLGACEIDTDNAASDILTFRVHLAPQTDDFAPAIRILTPDSQMNVYDEAIYDESRYDVDSGGYLVVGETVKAGEEDWAICQIQLDDSMFGVEAVLLNVTQGTTSLVDYHSAKVEYGPPTPYTPSLSEVKKDVSGLVVDMYEDSGKIETYRKTLSNSVEENKNAIAEITPEYIAESVSQQITYGTRNFILNSNIQRKSKDNLVTIFELSEAMEEDKVYTFSMDFIPASGVTRYNVCLSQGGQSLGYIIPYGTGRQVRTLTFLAKYARQTSTTIDPNKAYAWDKVSFIDNRPLESVKTYTKDQAHASDDSLFERRAVQGRRLIQEAGYTDVNEEKHYYFNGQVFDIAIPLEDSTTFSATLQFSSITKTGKELYTHAELEEYAKTFEDPKYVNIVEGSGKVLNSGLMYENDSKGILLMVADQESCTGTALALETLMQMVNDMEEYGMERSDVSKYKTEYLDPTITILDQNIDSANKDIYVYALPADYADRGNTVIYNAKLERGNASTGFTNAPEDNLYAGANLLRNGGFEMYSSTQSPLNWGMYAEGDATRWDDVAKKDIIIAETTFKVCGPNSDTATYSAYRNPAVNTVVVNRTGEFTDAQKFGIYSDDLNLKTDGAYMFSGYVSTKNATEVRIDVIEVEEDEADTEAEEQEKPQVLISSTTYRPILGNQDLSTWRRFEISFKAKPRIKVAIYAIGPKTADEDVVLLVTQCKIEEGFFATDYSPCVLDSSDIVGRLASAEQKITPDAIEQVVRERINYDDQIDAANASIKELQSTFTQTTDSFKASITSVQTNAQQALDQYAEKVESYIQFTEAGLELGKKGTDNAGFKSILSTEKLAFIQDGNEVAYISNNNLYITRAQIITSLEFGGIIATKDTDGSINWSWT